MILSEEYCVRNGLRYPIIKRPEKSWNLIYRADKSRWNADWLIFRVLVKPEQHKPSYFTFSWMLPIHNGSYRSNALEPISKPMDVQWDDFDIEVLKIAQRSDGLEPIKNLGEAKMASWEIFLFATDEKMHQLPISIREQIFISMDADLSIEDRMVAHEKAVEMISEHSPSILVRWKMMQQYYEPSEYAVWFADIVYQMRNQSYCDDFANLQSVA